MRGRPFIDETGHRYGKLTVLGERIPSRYGPKWRCQCDCGNTVYVRGDYLRSGHTKSCGCIGRGTHRILIHSSTYDTA